MLELRPPEGTHLDELFVLWPKFLSYVLSFVFLGIYWNNHHHLLHAVKAIDGRVLWANLHLLFWLSLIPFATSWMGEESFANIPVGAYGVVCLMAAVAFTLLVITLIRVRGQSQTIATAIGNDYKGKVSLAAYAIAIPVAFYFPIAAVSIYALVSMLWFVPDSRIERSLRE